MLPTTHRTTRGQVLAFVQANPGCTARQVGEEFWPDKACLGPARGGPSCAAVAAAFLLNKLMHAGYVRRAERPAQWYITAKGRAVG